MNKTRRMVFVLVLLVLALAASSVQAGQSTNYRLAWFTPLTTNGGGPSSSAHYTANVTVGQTAYDSSTGSNYQVSLGYWFGAIDNFHLRLPNIYR
jgi:hypothetical protein